jgi:Fe-Mn family superoxide dismutase
MSFTLPELPYSADAFKGLISATTFSYHHGKHHQKYVDELNKLIKGTAFEAKRLDEIVLGSEGAIFNNAAQHYNHSFFWPCLKPNGGGEPKGELKDAIDRDFGSFKAFRDQFKTTAEKHFGSGWAWLAINPKDKKLQVVGTHDGDTPITHGLQPIITLDVWEHAYYLDYQNRRPDFVEDFLSKMANWDFAAENYKKHIQ